MIGVNTNYVLDTNSLIMSLSSVINTHIYGTHLLRVGILCV